MLANFITTLAIDTENGLLRLLPQKIRNEFVRRIYPVPHSVIRINHPISKNECWHVKYSLSGHGVTLELFESILEPSGFPVKVYPHSHELDEEVLQGQGCVVNQGNRIG